MRFKSNWSLLLEISKLILRMVGSPSNRTDLLHVWNGCLCSTKIEVVRGNNQSTVTRSIRRWTKGVEHVTYWWNVRKYFVIYISRTILCLQVLNLEGRWYDVSVRTETFRPKETSCAVSVFERTVKKECDVSTNCSSNSYLFYTNPSRKGR